jgi:hypothetical protein
LSDHQINNVCVIFYDNERYDKLARCALQSFNYFHEKEVSICLVNHRNIHELESSQYIGKVSPGILKYIVCHEIFIKTGAKKLISLGADTITCSRLDEFLDSNEDILATLDYPYQLQTPRVFSPDSETHVNADVVCFNNPGALVDIINCALHHNVYFEQGGLNEVLWSGRHDHFTKRIVDYPYRDSKVVYNARSKGNFCAVTNTKPWAEFTQKFHVEDGKLFTGIHRNNPDIDKQIKVFHYCEGLGTLKNDKFEELVNDWLDMYFNSETKEFLKRITEYPEFFDKKFEV